MKSPWKEASTLILTALKKSSVISKWNYELLTLQRHSKSSFMPRGFVFPGGTTELFDSDKVWLDYFSSFKLDLINIVKINGVIPPIVANETGPVPKLLSLKIAAIRETFEETGILLCNNKNPKSVDSQNWVSFCVFEGLDSWRKKVQEDGKEFFNMCRHYNCFPDICNVHLWSNWLTPASMGKRFDTAFFTACLTKTPLAVADEREVENLTWSSPDELMRLSQITDMWLPPPQVYETARLLHFKDIEDLNMFAQRRCILGCDRWMPIQLKTLDGSVSVLPGDDAYNLSDYCTPKEPQIINLTNQDFRNQSKVIHRMEFLDNVKAKVIVKNYSPTSGHVLPISDC